MKQKAKPASGKGLVALHAGPEQTKPSARRVISGVRAGLEFGELEALREQLDLPMEQLSARLGLSRATLHRRKAGGRLTTDESDKVVRFARLLGHAVHLFGGAEEARLWLKAPQRGLGGAVPLDYAETETGAREVENLLGRIDYGVYS
jgi:putative toxin-antitoxin system antitoxin component (TIGR02293 family)